MAALDYHGAKLEYGYFYEWSILTQDEYEIDDLQQWGTGREPIYVPCPDGRLCARIESISEDSYTGPPCSCTPQRDGDAVRIPRRVELYTYEHVPPLIPSLGRCYLRNDLAESLLRSRLLGYLLSPLTYYCQSDGPFPRIFSLIAEDRDFTVHATVEPASANRCATCGYSPLLCPKCGLFPSQGCPKCGSVEFSVSEADGYRLDDPHRIVRPKDQLRTSLIDPHKWDGSDFFSGVITHRALQFLISQNAYPLLADPCPVDLSKADATVMEKLKRAKG